MSFLLNPNVFGSSFAAGLAGKFFNGTWRPSLPAGTVGTLPLTTANDSSNVTGTGGLPSAGHRFGVNLWPSIAYTSLGESYGFIAIGYFTPPTTGTYNFWTSSDDSSGVWVGTLASGSSGRTSANAVVNNGLGGTGQGNTKRGGSIALTGGIDYAIRIVHEEGGGGDNLTFSWSGPGISETTDLTTYFKTLTVGDSLFGNFIPPLPPPLLPQGVVPVTGAFSRYTADSFASTTWSDISGNNRHATVNRGSVSLSTSSGNGSTKTFGVLQGDTGDGILFPTDVLPSTYTLFHLSRYTGTSNQRIVTGTGNNWLSGHHSGRSGLAYHEGWLTAEVNRFGNNWVLSTDQNSLYRGNRTTYGTSGGSASTRLTVNAGQFTEYSAWQVAEIIVYNRTLSLEEYTSVENFLVDKYGLS